MSTTTSVSDNVAIIDAFAIVFLDSSRLNATQCLLVDALYTFFIIAKNVVVLIPPPVDPGDAPINIKITIVNNPALVKPLKGAVLNPAVLAEVL